MLNSKSISVNEPPSQTQPAFVLVQPDSTMQEEDQEDIRTIPPSPSIKTKKDGKGKRKTAPSTAIKSSKLRKLFTGLKAFCNKLEDNIDTSEIALADSSIRLAEKEAHIWELQNNNADLCDTIEELKATIEGLQDENKDLHQVAMELMLSKDMVSNLQYELNCVNDDLRMANELVEDLKGNQPIYTSPSPMSPFLSPSPLIGQEVEQEMVGLSLPTLATPLPSIETDRGSAMEFAVANNTSPAGIKGVHVTRHLFKSAVKKDNVASYNDISAGPPMCEECLTNPCMKHCPIGGWVSESDVSGSEVEDTWTEE